MEGNLVNEKVLTIVVPAYNAELYLEKCLASFICPNMRELEIIIINDGSTDNTPTIAQGFVVLYPGIYQLINKENGGHGSGINQAAAIATGKYFRVVDADDWISTQNLTSYLTALKNIQSDIVLTHFHTVDMKSGRRIPYKNVGVDYDMDYQPEDLLPIMEKAAHWFSLHSIAYRTVFYQGLSLSLTEKIFYEDTEFSVLPFADCRSIRLLDLSIYEYLVGNTTQSVSISSYCKRYHHLEIVLERILNQYQERKGINEAKDAFLRSRIRMLLGTYEKVMLIYLLDKTFGRKAVKGIRRGIRTIDAKILSKSGLKYLGLLICNYTKVSPIYLEALYSRYKNRLL